LIALQQERRRLIRDNRATRLEAWQQFQCATASLPTNYVAHYQSLVGIQLNDAYVEDVREDEWNHPLATDQVISVDPLTLSVTVAARRPRRGQNAPRDGAVRKRGRPPGPPKFKVRFAPVVVG